MQVQENTVRTLAYSKSVEISSEEMAHASGGWGTSYTGIIDITQELDGDYTITYSDSYYF